MKRFNGWKGQRGGSSKRSEVVKKRMKWVGLHQILFFPLLRFFFAILGGFLLWACLRGSTQRQSQERPQSDGHSEPEREPERDRDRE